MAKIKQKVLFTGCSFTAGSGWLDHPDSNKVMTDVDKNSEHLWVNICAKNIDRFKKLQVLNEGAPGASNTDIFTNTVLNLSRHGDEIDTIICQWTSGPRYNFNVGLEKWDTSEQIRDRYRKHDVKLSNGDVWSRDYIYDIMDRLLVMHHIHWEIVKIVKYTNIIKNIASQYDNVNCYFVNGLCPWDNDYFKKLENVFPIDYTEFTKNIVLEIDHRDDDDIYFLYDKIHQDYQDNGGIDSKYWINLYRSFQKTQVDTNFDNSHPGIKSNLLYADMISNIIEKHNEK